jgi:hypothetical protein
MDEVVLIGCVVRFLNEMRSGLRVDSKKFDLAVASRSHAPAAMSSPSLESQNPQFERRGKAGLPYAQLIDRIVRQGMKTTRD